MRVVRYLRMLTNSLLVGSVAALYLTLLVVLLNPALPLTFGATMPLFGVLLLSYGIHIAAATYVAFVVRQIAAAEPVWPAWVSLRVLAWTSGVAGVSVALLLWFNVRGLRTALDPPTLTALTQGAIVLGAGGALALILALTRTFVQRGPVVVASLFTVIALASISAPLVLRGGGLPPGHPSLPEDTGAATPADAPRAIVILLDGASLDVISPAVAAGRLPNFGRLLDNGVSMHLATARPTQPEPVWTTVMTGKWPAKHGILGAAVYRPFTGGRSIDVLPDLLFTQALLRFGFLVEQPYTTASLGATPLWRILSRQSVTAGVVGLPLTHPAEPLAGFMVSDRFHRRFRTVADLASRAAFYPPDISDDVLNASDDAEGNPWLAQLDLLPATGESGADVAADRVHHEVAEQLAAAEPVRVLLVRYAGLDAVAHYYLRYAMPQAFGDVSEEERERFGRVLDDYYAYVDSLVGTALQSLRPHDLLLVVSGFGMEPLTPGKRLLERAVGDARFSGTHERAPDGFLLAFGGGVASGRLSRGAIVDVAPTLLYFLDQAIGRDMDGFARTDIFTAAFNADHTITFIPTYDR